MLEYEDIRISRSGDQLVIANSVIMRTLDLAMGAPRTVSLCDGGGREFTAPDKPHADLSFIGLNHPGNEKTPWRLRDIAAEVLPGDLFDSTRVCVRLAMFEPVEQAAYTREYFIYPGLPVIAVQNFIECPVKPNIYWSRRGVYARNQAAPDYRHLAESCADSIRPASGIRPECSVEFTAITDITDELVAIHPAEGELLNGNLLFCAAADGAGFTYLQEAPPSGERRDYEAHDFRLDGDTILSCNWGIHPAELTPGKTFRGYRHALMIFHSAAERNFLLKKYLRTRFPFDVPKHHSILINPWGCGCFPKLVNKQFLLDEIAAAPSLGATHYQIDDAWQTGGSLSELSGKNRKVTPEFWTISSERLGGSFDALVSAARAAGVELGLWLAPSANSDYDDWREFGAMVLDYHRRFGFKMFKIDFIKIRTYTAEENLRELLAYLRTASGGEVYFNLDITNGQRTGYFHFLEFGNVFLENRYVSLGIGYHPEKTLRSLWRLSRFVRPQMLQIEVPSPDDISAEFYAAKPWCHPAEYPVEYWAAIAFFASPLLWLAPSRVSPEIRRRIKGIMDLHLQYRDRIFAGEVFAIGDEPDGAAMAALQCHDFADNTGLLTVYRELGNAKGETVLTMDYLPENPAWKIIHGEAEITSLAPGQIRLTIPQRPGFAIFSY